MHREEQILYEPILSHNFSAVRGQLNSSSDNFSNPSLQTCVDFLHCMLKGKVHSIFLHFLKRKRSPCARLVLDRAPGLFDKRFTLQSSWAFHCLPQQSGQVSQESRGKVKGLLHPDYLPGCGLSLGHTQAQEVLVHLHAELPHGSRPAEHSSLDLVFNLVEEDSMSKALSLGQFSLLWECSSLSSNVSLL